jgi:hypothetical protein
MNRYPDPMSRAEYWFAMATVVVLAFVAGSLL